MKVLFSIKEEFAEKIFSGKKRFEYRKAIPKSHISEIIVYVTKPTGKIVGEFTIESILRESPINIWKKTSKYSGIKKKCFFEYFKGKSFGYAIQIKNYTLYDQPINPHNYYRESDKKFVPPQSFKYL